MLFKDNLYSIVRQDIAEDVATFGLRLDADSVIFHRSLLLQAYV